MIVQNQPGSGAADPLSQLFAEPVERGEDEGIRCEAGKQQKLVAAFFSTPASPLSSEIPLLDITDFKDKQIKLGYGVGTVGLSLSPVAFGRHYTSSDIDPIFLIWFLGTVAFFTVLSEGQCLVRPVWGTSRSWS
ncbi:hypothetical protein [Natrinema sp. SYSU A 869]|uniref:hypothetical protein n=1 Tax=Natrinema sp. SYSU A 869 TaxID=2871694 RepID=UPI001CA3DA5C|nr:hypothetical protein [Natrinema sp. SYSU A 869]